MTDARADHDVDAFADVREVTPAEADRMHTESSAVLVDVREAGEWEQGHIPAAVHVPLGVVEQRIGASIPDRSTPVVLYCEVGIRSVFAAQRLRSIGFRDVASMAGGFVAWKSLGMPWTSSPLLSAEQARRYSRHLLIPEVGVEGQARLLASRVLLVGAGGLGSPAALYLAAAGVGTIGIIDFDVVEVSNLQRQVLHTTDRVGEKKVASATAAITALNPDVTVIARDEVLGPANVASLIAGYDVIIDGTDTFETRYTLNDAAVAARIPVVHASVFRFEGQLTTLIPFEGPCYRCLYPTQPPPELAPGCSVAGVLGVVPGIMGLLQANEALKILLGIGEPLVGRLLLFDALDGTFTELTLRRDPACPVCSDAAVAAARDGAAPATTSTAVPAPATEALRFPFPPPTRDIPA